MVTPKKAFLPRHCIRANAYAASELHAVCPIADNVDEYHVFQKYLPKGKTSNTPRKFETSLITGSQ